MRFTQDQAFSILRIAFGCVWLIDASFKWNPAFIDNFSSYLTETLDGQPPLVQAWLNLWVKTVGVNPHLFAYLVAMGETAIALGLIFGFLTKGAHLGGMAMSLVIWSTAEGFGGPYAAGSTDIGAAIIYFLLHVSLWLGKSWRYYSFDEYLYRKYSFSLGRW
jgi:uncharacterized membrane protein YphA (DoxX/SURF4 family)